MKKKTLILSMIIVLLTNFVYAKPAEDLLVTLRAAGKQLGFNSIHQIRATYAVASGYVSVEEYRIDLRTGNSQRILKGGAIDTKDPLGNGVPDDELPIKAGEWRSTFGSLYWESKQGQWLPTVVPLKDSTELHLSRMSVEWGRVFAISGSARSQCCGGDDSIATTYPPLNLTEESNDVHKRSGNFESTRMLEKGMVKQSITKLAGVVVERIENRLEGLADLTPGPAEQKLLSSVTQRHPFNPVEARPAKRLPMSSCGFGLFFQADSKSDQITVVNVAPGSPADKAALKTGDILMAINGIPSRELLNSIAAVFASIDSVTLSVKNSAGTREVRLEKAEKSSFATP